MSGEWSDACPGISPEVSLKFSKTYHSPATPYQRLLADARTNEDVRRRATATYATLDPVRLLKAIREARQELVALADRPVVGEAAEPSAVAGSIGTTWPITSQSNSMHTAASCCFTPGPDSALCLQACSPLVCNSGKRRGSKAAMSFRNSRCLPTPGNATQWKAPCVPDNATAFSTSARMLRATATTAMGDESRIRAAKLSTPSWVASSQSELCC